MFSCTVYSLLKYPVKKRGVLQCPTSDLLFVDLNIWKCNGVLHIESDVILSETQVSFI